MSPRSLHPGTGTDSDRVTRLTTYCREHAPTSRHDQNSSFSSRIHVMNHNWSATKQHLHPQSVAEISRHSVFFRGQNSTMWDFVWVSPQGHRSVSVSRHFLLQAPQCPCSAQKRFNRDHCCRGRSKPGCRIVGSYTR